MVQNKFKGSILRVQSDNGSKFTNGPYVISSWIKAFCLKHHVLILLNEMVELSVKIDTF